MPDAPALAPDRDPRRALGGLRRWHGGDGAVLPPALRRADAQAAPSGLRGRVPGRDDRESEQPRAGTASQATSPMEVEVMRSLAVMFGLPVQALGHLTSSGTIANLEALWVARELAPETAVVHSEAAHYTHGRMCQVLGVESRAVPTHPDGRVDLDAVTAEVRRGGVGTVVLNPRHDGPGCGRRHPRCAGAQGAPWHSAPRRRRLRRVLLLARRARRLCGDRSVRLGGGRSAQARAPAVRLRRRAVRRSHRRALLHPRLALHVLHLGGVAPRRDLA